MNSPLVEVTLAILHQDGRFLMQLRDDIPTIVHPGIWGFFGGHIEPGEDATAGLIRELTEEIAYSPEQVALFCEQTEERVHDWVRRYYFYAELTVPMSDLVLSEGQDMALCSPSEIQAGEKYSKKLGEVRQMGKHHRQTLLDFIDSGLMQSGV